MKTKEITITAIFIAITLILALIPNLGIIQIGAISITIMHLPVIVAALTLNRKQTLIIALCFGFCSWLVALTRAITPMDLLFQNPLVAIIPRFLFGLAATYLATIFKQEKLRVVFTATIATLIHTILVLSTVIIAGPELFGVVDFSGGIVSLWTLIITVISSNGIIEMLVSAIVMLPLVRAVNTISNKTIIKT
ncbi:MAG: ECF transporter S component [Erysipelotrichaceae bacterium]